MSGTPFRTALTGTESVKIAFGDSYLSQFQHLLVEISSSFIHLQSEEINASIVKALQQLAEFVGADRCYIFDYDFGQQICINTHEWCREGIEPQIDNLKAVPLSEIPQWVETHLEGKEVSIPDVHLLEPGGLRTILEAQDILSLISVPMVKGDLCIGFVGFDSVNQKRDYHDSEKQLLRIFSNILVNVTERKRALELAVISESRYEEIMSVITDVIWRYEVDEHQQFVGGYISPAVDQQLGLPHGTIGNNFQKYFSFIHPDDLPIVLERFQTGLLNAVRFDTHEYRLITHGGSVAWIQTRGSARRQPNGHVIAYGSSSDITERVKAAEEILMLNRELEQRVRERTNQLEETKNELEAFCYSVSHDLRAPIRAMNCFAKILSEEYGSNLDHEGRRLTGIISTNAMKMGDLIDDLLALSRLSNQVIEFTAIDMKEMVVLVFNESTSPEDRQKIEFIINDMKPCLGDPVLMKQVWTNLISNAVKFSSKKPHRIIEVGETMIGDQPTYFIRDNGTGFDMAYAGKLFGVFQRLHNVREFEGNGVGLAIVHRIIQRMNGRIWAEGEAGLGATFYFTIRAC